MLRLLILALLACPLSAQTFRFEWKAGEVHKFRVTHDTTISETASNGTTSTTRSKLAISKAWTVKAVNADGSATLSLSITAVRNEMTRPIAGRDGKIIDETNVVDSSTPEGAKMMAEYLSKPILTAIIDTRGRVSDVQATFPDAAQRLQQELPFRVLLPEGAIAADTKWDREFPIKLGAGETHDATQSFAVEKLDPARTLFKVRTSLKTEPKEHADLQPLIPWLWEGTVSFDPAAKKYLGAKLSVVRETANYAGAGSKFSFRSDFTETRE